jgi:hypothetical protein
MLFHSVELEKGKAGFKSDNYIKVTDPVDRPFS